MFLKKKEKKDMFLNFHQIPINDKQDLQVNALPNILTSVTKHTGICDVPYTVLKGVQQKLLLEESDAHVFHLPFLICHHPFFPKLHPLSHEMFSTVNVTSTAEPKNERVLAEKDKIKNCAMASYTVFGQFRRPVG